MLTTPPGFGLSPQVREAFDEACLSIFSTRAPPSPANAQTHDLLLGFASHYQRMSALPRRTRRSLKRRWKCTLTAIALLLTLANVPAWAATIEVTAGVPPSIYADGRCSLIEAIVNANRDQRTHMDCAAGSGADTILLPAKSTQWLKARQSLPQINSRIVIEGRDSTIRRSTTTETYNDIAGLTFFRIGATGDLTLNKITVSGATPSGVSGGDGVRIDGGFVTLNDTRIMNMRTGFANNGGIAVLRRSKVSGSGPTDRSDGVGGGIWNWNSGTLVLFNSEVTGNKDVFGGGGITNSSMLTIVDSVVADNSLTYEGPGGGISNHGTLTLIGSTVSGNVADIGGGIFNSGTATLVDSTISGNRAFSAYSYGGGGIATRGGKVRLDNCTVSGNSAPYGGGLYVTGGSALTISNSTVTGNIARSEPAGAGLFVYEGTVNLHHTVVSDNTASLWAAAREIRVVDYVPSSAVVIADDHNLFGHSGDAGTVGFTPGLTDIVPNKPIGGILLPLADNGGGTRTHALAIGSPALDRSPNDYFCPKTDQRGNPRPRGPACDIGAFEGVAVLCNGMVTTMVGTVGSDTLTGTAGPDVISGLGGDDIIYGLEGNDVICGGFGADRLFGGPGRDLLFGGPDNDRLSGQGGDDTLDGGTGQDVCDGGGHWQGDTATACETVNNVP